MKHNNYVPFSVIPGPNTSGGSPGGRGLELRYGADEGWVVCVCRKRKKKINDHDQSWVIMELL
jgi:hypothetical protein